MTLHARELDWNPKANITALAHAAVHHWRQNDINWPLTIYLGVVHVGFAQGAATLASCRWQTLFFVVALLGLSELGITGGAHRLWSHRSYKAHWTLRLFLMVCFSMANQGSIYHWARDHRVHHKYSEEDADPHNASRGFFFAHIGWLLVKKHPEVLKAGRKLDLSDLEDDPVVMFQRTHHALLALFMCFILPGALPHFAWGEPLWNGVWVAGFFRYVACLHATWLVNSAAHFFGHRPYDERSWPGENALVSAFTMGEGWHNWHHKYPFDYSASELGVSMQFNPTRMFIDFMAFVGLVTDRKRALRAWKRAKQAQKCKGT